MLSQADLSNIVDAEIGKYVNDDVTVDNENHRSAVTDMVRSYFDNNVLFNEVTTHHIKCIQNALDKGVDMDIKNSVIMSSKNISNITEMVKFFRDNDGIETINVSDKWCILKGVSLECLYQTRSFIEGPLVYVSLSTNNLFKYRELVRTKVFSYSTDKKFMASGKNYKVVINVTDNVPLNELSSVGRRDHYVRIMENLYKSLVSDGYQPTLGTANGVYGHRMVLFCNDLPNMNILKLYRLNHVNVSVPCDRVVWNDEDFEDIFQYFI